MTNQPTCDNCGSTHCIMDYSKNYKRIRLPDGTFDLDYSVEPDVYIYNCMTCNNEYLWEDDKCLTV